MHIKQCKVKQTNKQTNETYKSSGKDSKRVKHESDAVRRVNGT